MLIIELLVLVLISIEVAWSGRDRYLKWRERKNEERRALQQLALLDATQSAALRNLFLHRTQPSDETAMWIRSKADWTISRDSVSYYIPEKHRKLLKRWIKEEDQ